jgi:hypothetical protein
MTVGTYIPSATDERIFGLDISSNQGLIDFAKMGAAKPRPRFVISRTGISWGYKDKYHRLYHEALGEIGIPRATYHVIYPDQPIKSQLDNYLSMFPNKDYGEGPIVNDVELVRDVSPEKLSNAVEYFNKALEDATGKEVWWYSRYSFVATYMKYQPWMESRRCIMAMYVDGSKYPPVREWTAAPAVPASLKYLPLAMIQTGDKGDGPYFGTVSNQVDTDRCLLTEDEFAKAFSQPASVPEPVGWVQAIDTWARRLGFDGPKPEDN